MALYDGITNPSAGRPFNQTTADDLMFESWNGVARLAEIAKNVAQSPPVPLQIQASAPQLMSMGVG